MDRHGTIKLGGGMQGMNIMMLFLCRNLIVLSSEWGGRIFFSNGTTQARGVMIMIKRNVELSIHNVSQWNKSGA